MFDDQVINTSINSNHNKKYNDAVSNCSNYSNKLLRALLFFLKLLRPTKNKLLKQIKNNNINPNNFLCQQSLQRY